MSTSEMLNIIPLVNAGPRSGCVDDSGSPAKCATICATSGATICELSLTFLSVCRYRATC